ncbi:MAG: DUF4291 domain-containing protein [Alistipes senegalensis]|nr:DUF4291 domain-containing protein [Alistipes senegalensis]
MEYVKEIFAHYDKKFIRVYQAYNPTIANQAVKLQNFGESFNLNRMTWIKPSFLWLMYRSNWGTKKNQECILSIDIHREVFDSLLAQAVLTSPDSSFSDGKEWEKQFNDTAVYCQFDPDRNINGNPINRSAIQIGVKGSALSQFLDGIYRIEDLTPSVRKWNALRKNGKLNMKDLPVERLYPVNDRKIRNRLDM